MTAVQNRRQALRCYQSESSFAAKILAEGAMRRNFGAFGGFAALNNGRAGVSH
jgi:hypothetical protein